MKKVKVLDRTLVVFHTNNKVDIYDIRGILEKVIPDVVGKPRDIVAYPESTWGPYPMQIDSPVYGNVYVGLPLTETFADKPELLYQFSTRDYYCIWLKQTAYYLIADSKTGEPHVIKAAMQSSSKSTASNTKIPGLSLAAADELGRYSHEPGKEVIFLHSGCPRLVFWNGSRLQFCSIKRAKSDADVMVLHKSIRPSFTQSPNVTTPVVCTWLKYNEDLDMLAVIFGQSDDRLLYIIDGKTSDVISVTDLTNEPVTNPRTQKITDIEEVWLHETGFLYLQTFRSARACIKSGSKASFWYLAETGTRYAS